MERKVEGTKEERRRRGKKRWKGRLSRKEEFEDDEDEMERKSKRKLNKM